MATYWEILYKKYTIQDSLMVKDYTKYTEDAGKILCIDILFLKILICHVIYASNN